MKTETAVIRCSTCETHQVGTVEGRYRHPLEQGGHEFVRISLVRCPQCSDPFLTREVGVEEQDEWDPNQIGWSWGQSTFLFPADSGQVDQSVPATIARSYLEGRRAFEQASAYTAAAILCRRTLEGICNNLGARGRNLQDKLLALKSSGVIESRLYDWADDVLRTLGNDAAHDVEQDISRDDAKDALEFTKALIEYLYVFEAAFRRFKARRAQPGKPPIPALEEG